MGPCFDVQMWLVDETYLTILMISLDLTMLSFLGPVDSP